MGIGPWISPLGDGQCGQDALASHHCSLREPVTVNAPWSLLLQTQGISTQSRGRCSRHQSQPIGLVDGPCPVLLLEFLPVFVENTLIPECCSVLRHKLRSVLLSLGASQLVIIRSKHHHWIQSIHTASRRGVRDGLRRPRRASSTLSRIRPPNTSSFPKTESSVSSDRGNILHISQMYSSLAKSLPMPHLLVAKIDFVVARDAIESTC